MEPCRIAVRIGSLEAAWHSMQCRDYVDVAGGATCRSIPGECVAACCRLIFQTHGWTVDSSVDNSRDIVLSNGQRVVAPLPQGGSREFCEAVDVKDLIVAGAAQLAKYRPFSGGAHAGKAWVVEFVTDKSLWPMNGDCWAGATHASAQVEKMVRVRRGGQRREAPSNRASSICD
jgi:hypothetical protein